MKQITIIFIAVLLMSACSKTNEEELSFTLKKLKEYSLPIDAYTAYNNKTYQFYKDKTTNKNYISLLNQKNNSIYIYDYLSQKLIKKIQYDVGGPEGKGRLVSFYIHNLDSIFLINYNRKIILVDSNKNQKFSITTSDIASSTPLLPDIVHTSTVLPISKIEHNLFVNGVFIGVKEIKPVYKLNLNSLKLKTLFHFPNIEAYTNNKKLDIYSYLYFSCFNEDNKTICYSFPADDSITVTNHNSISIRYAAKSKYFEKIDPYMTDNANIADERYEYINAKKNLYYAIIYDKYEKMYYRFVKLGISDKDYNSGDYDKRKEKQFAVIMIDKNFNKVGELLMKKFEYDASTIFVNEKGLHILNRKLSIENENKVFFTIFKPQKLKN